jgi:hypothetical protein
LDINYKKQYFRLWNKGILGNKLRSWKTIEDIKKDNLGEDTYLVMRYLEPSTTTVKYKSTLLEIEKEIKHLISNGYYEESKFIFNEAAPDEKLLIQGEVMLGIYGYNLTYSLLKLPMREALKQSVQYVNGLKTLILLEKYLEPNSIDNLKEILNKYPDHVIEFSTYSIVLGHLQQNTVIWEVRNY